MIARKQGPVIVDDLKPPPGSESRGEVHEGDDGDIATPKSEPPTEDDKPLD
jgi:hypothetical protein